MCRISQADPASVGAKLRPFDRSIAMATRVCRVMGPASRRERPLCAAAISRRIFDLGNAREGGGDCQIRLACGAIGKPITAVIRMSLRHRSRRAIEARIVLPDEQVRVRRRFVGDALTFRHRIRDRGWHCKSLRPISQGSAGALLEPVDFEIGVGTRDREATFGCMSRRGVRIR